MITKVIGEQPFQVLATNFSISPSNEGYTLQISADGINFSNLFQVGANVTRMVTGAANGSYYRLLGNNSEVSVNWSRQCSTGGGDVDLSNYYTKSETDEAIANAIEDIEPVDLSNYYNKSQTDQAISSATQNFVTSAQVETQIVSKNYITSGDAKTQIESYNYITSADTVDFVTSAVTDEINEHLDSVEEVTSIALNELNDKLDEIDLSNYVTKDIIEESEQVTAGALNNVYEWVENVEQEVNNRQVILVSGQNIKTIDNQSILGSWNLTITPDLSAYWTSAQTKNNIDGSLADVGIIVTDPDSGSEVIINVSDLKTKVDRNEVVVSTALNEVHQDIVELSGATANMVTSDYGSGNTVSSIWRGTQAEYDTLTQSGSTANPNTFYIITNSNS